LSIIFGLINDCCLPFFSFESGSESDIALGFDELWAVDCMGNCLIFNGLELVKIEE
jgi:hypothetical protein